MASGSNHEASNQHNLKHELEESRFFEAIKTNDVKSVEKMLCMKGFHEYLRQHDKLLLAVLQVVLLNNVMMLNVFIKHGVDVTGEDLMFFENGIMHAVRYGHKEMLEHLICCGINVNHQSKTGSTALHIAIENMQHECLQALMEQRNIDLNIQDYSGYSPLLWTARLRDWVAMKILLDAGANVEKKNFFKGATALHVVVDSSQAFWKGEKGSVSDTFKCIDLLLDAGLDINVCDVYKIPPLLYAINSNNIPAICYLLKANCSFNSYKQCSPYHFTEQLTGADPELQPLYVALDKLQVKTVQMLCLAGIAYHRLSRELDLIQYVHQYRQRVSDVIQVLLSTPVSLKQACRTMARRCMGANIRHVTDRDLQLPTDLMKYLRLDDLDEL